MHSEWAGRGGERSVVGQVFWEVTYAMSCFAAKMHAGLSGVFQEQLGRSTLVCELGTAVVSRS